MGNFPGCSSGWQSLAWQEQGYISSRECSLWLWKNVDKSKKQNSSFILFTIYIVFDVPKMPSRRCSWKANYIPWKGERRKVWLVYVIPFAEWAVLSMWGCGFKYKRQLNPDAHMRMRSQFLSQLFLLPSNSTALDQPVFCKDVPYIEHLEIIQIHGQWRYQLYCLEEWRGKRFQFQKEIYACSRQRYSQQDQSCF